MALDQTVNGDRKKPFEKDGPSLRFDLQVHSPTSDTFSEFSYVQLVRQNKKKKLSSGAGSKSDLGSSSLTCDDSVEDSNQHLTSIARKFEEKYGPKPSKKRKRMIHDSDYIDRGFGYDLADSFVDDSEFYEDFVPDHVETKYGGFYVNTGELEFKAADDIDDVDFVVKKSKKPKIRKQPSHQTPQAILASQKLKKAKQHALQKAPQGAKKSLFPSGGLSRSSSTNTNKKSSAPPAPKKPRLKLNSIPQSTSSLVSQSFPTAVVPISIGDRSVTVPIFSSSLKDGTRERDSTASSVVSCNPLKSVPGQMIVKPETVTDDPTTSCSPTAIFVPKPPPVLPGNLPATVLEVVTKIMETIKMDQTTDKKISNKQKDTYNETLVEIEMACKSVSMKARNAVFDYLAHHLGVARGTLTKRMKQMFKKKEDIALEEPLQKLKKAVELSMPRQIALYEEEFMKARSESSSLIEKGLETDEDTKGDVFDDQSLLSLNQVESQLPEGPSVESHPPVEQAEGGVVKPKRLPRKRYRWNDNEEVKRLLLDVVRVKVKSEESCSRFNREKGEEVIGQFLDDKVKPFWPKGWMQRSILYKISEPVHKTYTTPLPRKGVTVKKEKVSAAKKEPVELKLISKEVLKKAVPATQLISPYVTVTNTSSPHTTTVKLSGMVATTLTTASHPIISATKEVDSLVLPRSYGVVKDMLSAKPDRIQPLPVDLNGDHLVSPSTVATNTIPQVSSRLKPMTTTSASVMIPSASKINYLLQSTYAQQSQDAVRVLTNTPQDATYNHSTQVSNFPTGQKIHHDPVGKSTPQVHLQCVNPVFSHTTPCNPTTQLSQPAKVVNSSSSISGIQHRSLKIDTVVNKLQIVASSHSASIPRPPLLNKHHQITLLKQIQKSPHTIAPNTMRNFKCEVGSECQSIESVIRKDASQKEHGSPVIEGDNMTFPVASISSPFRTPTEQILEEHSYRKSSGDVPPVACSVQSQHEMSSYFTASQHQQEHNKDSA